MTKHFEALMSKAPDAKLTRDELACALYEGTRHVQNLGEKLARQHGQADALTFFDMMGPEVQNFWKTIADQLIDHSEKWGPNKGSACVCDLEELKRLEALPRVRARIE